MASILAQDMSLFIHLLLRYYYDFFPSFLIFPIQNVSPFGQMDDTAADTQRLGTVDKSQDVVGEPSGVASAAAATAPFVAYLFIRLPILYYSIHVHRKTMG